MSAEGSFPEASYPSESELKQNPPIRASAAVAANKRKRDPAEQDSRNTRRTPQAPSQQTQQAFAQASDVAGHGAPTANMNAPPNNNEFAQDTSDPYDLGVLQDHNHHHHHHNGSNARSDPQSPVSNMDKAAAALSHTYNIGDVGSGIAHDQSFLNTPSASGAESQFHIGDHSLSEFTHHNAGSGGAGTGLNDTPQHMGTHPSDGSGNPVTPSLGPTMHSSAISGPISSSTSKPAVGTHEWHKVRKDNHKEVERRRRETINEGINELAKIVPGCEKNKGSILARTVDYIRRLQDEKHQDLDKWTFEKLITEQAISAMSDKVQRLADERNAWKRIAKEHGADVDNMDLGLPSREDDEAVIELQEMQDALASRLAAGVSQLSAAGERQLTAAGGDEHESAEEEARAAEGKRIGMEQKRQAGETDGGDVDEEDPEAEDVAATGIDGAGAESLSATKVTEMLETVANMASPRGRRNKAGVPAVAVGGKY